MLVAVRQIILTDLKAPQTCSNENIYQQALGLEVLYITMAALGLRFSMLFPGETWVGPSRIDRITGLDDPRSDPPPTRKIGVLLRKQPTGRTLCPRFCLEQGRNIPLGEIRASMQ
jgi:hypothetical protein